MCYLLLTRLTNIELILIIPRGYIKWNKIYNIWCWGGGQRFSAYFNFFLIKKVKKIYKKKIKFIKIQGRGVLFFDVLNIFCKLSQ